MSKIAVPTFSDFFNRDSTLELCDPVEDNVFQTFRKVVVDDNLNLMGLSRYIRCQMRLVFTLIHFSNHPLHRCHDKWLNTKGSPTKGLRIKGSRRKVKGGG